MSFDEVGQSGSSDADRISVAFGVELAQAQQVAGLGGVRLISNDRFERRNRPDVVFAAIFHESRC